MVEDVERRVEDCPKCHRNTLCMFIDPEIGGYVQCMACDYLLTEESFDESEF